MHSTYFFMCILSGAFDLILDSVISQKLTMLMDVSLFWQRATSQCCTL